MGASQAWRSVFRSANRFSVEPACSNADQNNADARNSTRIAQKRPRSCRREPVAAENSQMKKTTAEMPSRISRDASEIRFAFRREPVPKMRDQYQGRCLPRPISAPIACSLRRRSAARSPVTVGAGRLPEVVAADHILNQAGGMPSPRPESSRQLKCSPNSRSHRRRSWRRY